MRDRRSRAARYDLIRKARVVARRDRERERAARPPPGRGLVAARELGTIPVDPAATPEAKLTARNELAAGNTAVVVWHARRFLGSGLDINDLVGHGNLGLLKAAGRYDYRKGYRFTTYAGYLISQAIGKGLDDAPGPIRVPIEARLLLRRWVLAHDRLASELGPLPEPEEVDAATGPPRRKAALARSARDARVGKSRGLGGVVMPCPLPRPDEAAELAELKVGPRPSLAALPPAERRVIERRFGLSGEPEILEDIGRSLGICRERIRQLEEKALRRLRRAMGVSGEGGGCRLRNPREAGRDDRRAAGRRREPRLHRPGRDGRRAAAGAGARPRGCRRLRGRPRGGADLPQAGRCRPGRGRFRRGPAVGRSTGPGDESACVRYWPLDNGWTVLYVPLELLARGDR